MWHKEILGNGKYWVGWDRMGWQTSPGTHLEPHFLKKWVNFSVPDLLSGVHEVEESTKGLGPTKNRQGSSFCGLSSTLSPCSAQPLLYVII